MQLVDRINSEHSLTQRAGPRGTALTSGAANNNAANTVTITADGGKRVTAVIDPNKTYVFKDKKTGQIEIMGKGEEGARAAAARGQAISSANKKNKSDWRVYAVDDPNSNPKTWGKAVLYDKHHSSVIGKIADIALPVVGTLVAGPLGAAAGSALSGAAQGRSIGNILKGAAIAGVGSYAGGQLFGPATGKVTSNLASSALKDSLANGALGSLGGSVASTTGAGIGALGGGLSTAAGDIVVNGIRQAGGSALGSALGAAGTSALTAAVPTGGGGTASQQQQPLAPDEQPPIVVDAQTGLPSSLLNAGPLAVGALSTAGIDAMVQQAEAALKQKGFNPSTGQIITALQLLGGLGSAGASGGAGTGNQSLAPVFSKALPAPGAGFAARVPRNVNTDWNTYATRPEESFFSNVPVRGYAQGGSIEHDFAVPTMSDGRSDDRPIMASNGEYVVDAETVALLGNGSTEAGARKLDEFRVNLRKQKGAALAQGRFTPPARMPEAYMGTM